MIDGEVQIMLCSGTTSTLDDGDWVVIDIDNFQAQIVQTLNNKWVNDWMTQTTSKILIAQCW